MILEKVLISSCLVGNRVRYDGGCLAISSVDFDWLKTHAQIMVFCPEVAAGLPTPRAPAEIIGRSGHDVLEGLARVLGNDGYDVTEPFINGAHQALAICVKHNIKYAILAEGSPSCGSSTIYDGSFSGTKINGSGVTATLLHLAGIRVFNQHTIATLKEELATECCKLG